MNYISPDNNQIIINSLIKNLLPLSIKESLNRTTAMSTYFGITLTSDLNRIGYHQENTPQHRLRDIPVTNAIPEHLRGHGRFGGQGDINKVIWKGQFLYNITPQGSRLM